MASATELDLSNRLKLYQQLSEKVYDLVVIGGGITGAGVARDAAMRGLSVVLIEARDFASGTSSRSSKMIHGGLRYLAQGDIPVVKESARERATLHRIAPHLAQRTQYILPATSKASELTLSAALWTFEKLGKVSAPDRHQVWKPDEIAQREPLLNTKLLHSAIVYPEYLTDDARLTVATLRSAHAHGAIVANYVKAIGVSKDKHFSVICQTQLGEDAQEFEIRAHAAVNAAGPWVDAVCEMENPDQAQRLALSRGIHVVVDRETLPINQIIVMSTPDKRRIFSVPLGPYTYIGTTDELYPDSDYWPPIQSSDIDYLFTSTQKVMNGISLSVDDIVSVWSGIRPLVRSDGKSAKEMSRKDEIWVGPTGMLSIGGGKLSAYRAMAERIVDQVVTQGGFSAKPCTTGDEPLPGGETAPDPGLYPQLSTTAQERLCRLYGSEVDAIVGDGADVGAEARRAVRVEGAVRLEDYWARRSSRAFFDHAAGLTILTEAADAMGNLLNWSPQHKATEVANCITIDRQSKRAFQSADAEETK